MLLICLMMDLTIDHSESLMMVTILKAQRQPQYDFTSYDDDDANDHTDDFDHDGLTNHCIGWSDICKK